MKTITTTVQITYQIPEYDPDGDPVTDQDEGMPKVTSIVQDGKDITADRLNNSLRGCELFWGLYDPDVVGRWDDQSSLGVIFSLE